MYALFFFFLVVVRGSFYGFKSDVVKIKKKNQKKCICVYLYLCIIHASTWRYKMLISVSFIFPFFQFLNFYNAAPFLVTKK